MNTPTVEAEVRRIVAEELNLDLIDIAPSTWLQADLGADSLALIEILLHLEDAFGLDIPDEDVTPERDFQVRDVVDYIARRTAESQTGGEDPKGGASR